MSWLRRTARNVGLVVAAPARAIVAADRALGNPSRAAGFDLQRSPVNRIFQEGGFLGKGPTPPANASDMYGSFSGVIDGAIPQSLPPLDENNSKQKNQQLLLVLGAVFVGLLVLFNPDSPPARRKRGRPRRTMAARRTMVARRKRYGRSKTASEIKAERLRNLAKARRAKRAKAKR